MTSNDLLRRLRRLGTKRGWPYRTKPGNGSHLKVWLNNRRTVIPIHTGDLNPKTFKSIKTDLGLTDTDLEV